MRKKPPINTHVGVSSSATGLGFWSKSATSTPEKT